MTTLSVSLSLSRLHKVNERIKALIAEKTESLAVAQRPAHIALNGSVATLTRLKSAGKAAFNAAADIQALLLVQATLRQKVSSSNEHLGISNLLALQEALKRSLAIKRGLLPEATAATLAEVEQQLLDYQAKGAKDTYPESVEASVLTPAMTSELASQVRSLQAEIYAMSDTVARLNATIVQVELPTQLAQQLGLC